MKFEITYTDGTKSTITILDAQLLELLDHRVKGQAQQTATDNEAKRGLPVSCKVV